MGIVRQLIQIAATEAVRGRTIAEDRVFDSLIKAVPLILEDQNAPVIAVSIEDTLSQAEGGLFREDVEMTLMLQLAVAKAVKVAVQVGEGQAAEVQQIEIGDTDAAFEATLNLMDRQIRIALSDPKNSWSELFRTLAPGIGKITDIRLTDPESGRRYAARVIEMTLRPIAEPHPGQSDTDVVSAALDQIATVPDYAETAAILQESLEAGEGLFDWQKVQAQLLTTSAVPKAIGIGTPDNLGEVTLSDATIHIEGEISEETP